MTSELPAMQGAVCPVPLPHNEQIVMGHGSGGRMTQELIRKVFHPHFANAALDANNDFAAFSNTNGKRIALSTDAHIVSPLFFPGGDIGRLAVCGTVNDVAMSGAIPVALTASFIIEEGFRIADLDRIAASMAAAAEEAGVIIAAGDTKVVEKGKADGVFISTSGFGFIPDGIDISGSLARPGDAVIISGTLGDHGMAVLAARGDLGLESQILSDVAPLNKLIEEILRAGIEVHVLRDPTRGGLATTLNEIAGQSSVNITLEEMQIPIRPTVASICELLGFDPLYVANEGKMIIITPETNVAKVLDILHKHPYGKDAVMIGKVNDKPKATVLLKTRIGSTRILDVMAGEMLPRIC
jgi:hydrogenase expression/formation protein HypE